MIAIKVLPTHMASSPEVRQRFEREAKTISQLSHPHICALYDVGREGETEYLVMELLEGETLSDRLAKGPLPLEQTLRYGTEIADALDKTHRSGPERRDWSFAERGATTYGPFSPPSTRRATGNASCSRRATPGPMRPVASTWS
jgi:serine/threonine protein kinase